MKVVVCAGMPRSGSTLQWQLTREIVHLEAGRSLRVSRAVRDAGANLDWIDAKIRRDGDCPCYLVAKLHILYERILAYKPRVITCTRDPRGIAASMLCVDKEFQRVIATEGLPRKISNFHKWLQHPPTLVQKYEEFTQDLPTAAREIAAFLEIELPKDFAEGLGKFYSRERHEVWGWSGHTLTYSDWREDLSEQEQHIIVALCKDFMEEMGYA